MRIKVCSPYGKSFEFQGKCLTVTERKSMGLSYEVDGHGPFDYEAFDGSGRIMHGGLGTSAPHIVIKLDKDGEGDEEPV